MLKIGVDLLEISSNGSNMLHHLLRGNLTWGGAKTALRCISNLENLIVLGVDVNARDRGGETPLLAGLANPTLYEPLLNGVVVDILVQAGADLAVDGEEACRRVKQYLPRSWPTYLALKRAMKGLGLTVHLWE